MPRRTSGLVLLLLAGLSLGLAGERSLPTHPAEPKGIPTDSFDAVRQKMVDGAIVGWGIQDPTVIQAMRVVPRHLFVPEDYLQQAYVNRPLPIGHGQTISQPYIVALMTEALSVGPGDRVLEIGTGSGYQAAVLAECGVEVYSIEIIRALADLAREQLRQAGYDEVHLRHADGYWGWPEEAPFDAIIVTAAPDHVPQPLLEQIEVGGVLVIPIGPPGGYQELWRIERVAEDEFRSVSLGGVRFVPLTRSGETDGP